MFKSIVFALLFTSGAVFAMSGGGSGLSGREIGAKTLQILNCEISLIAQLSPAQQTFHARAKALIHKVDLLRLVTPDTLSENNLSEENFDRPLLKLVHQWKDGVIFGVGPSARHHAEDIVPIAILLNTLDHLDSRLSNALQPKGPRQDISEGKSRMESRGFRESWE